MFVIFLIVKGKALEKIPFVAPEHWWNNFKIKKKLKTCFTPNFRFLYTVRWVQHIILVKLAPLLIPFYGPWTRQPSPCLALTFEHKFENIVITLWTLKQNWTSELLILIFVKWWFDWTRAIFLTPAF
jgi:hypothetical protein